MVWPAVGLDVEPATAGETPAIKAKEQITETVKPWIHVNLSRSPIARRTLIVSSAPSLAMT
jgi:hypothetical protein